MATDILTLTQTEQAVVYVLGAQPGTARTMSSEAIAVEALVGPNAVILDDEGPTQGQMAEFDAAARMLHEKGLVEMSKVFGTLTWCLSKAGQEL